MSTVIYSNRRQDSTSSEEKFRNVPSPDQLSPTESDLNSSLLIKNRNLSIEVHQSRNKGGIFVKQISNDRWQFPKRMPSKTPEINASRNKDIHKLNQIRVKTKPEAKSRV